MRKLIYGLMVSLDGFIEGPNQDLGWATIDEELHRFVNEQERELGALLYGRRTYEVMAGYWPTADTNPASSAFEVEYARIWKSIPKIVFSKTLEQVEGNATLVKDNPIEVVMRLKEQPGEDLALGGASLASTFIQHNMIDEYQLYIHPVVLGSGTPMFPGLDMLIHLQLLESRPFASGVVFLRYQRAGAA